MENEGISESLQNTFLVYLISHQRPIAELLSPHRIDIKESFKKEFESMTTDVVTIEELEQAREELISTISTMLTDQDKQFLLDLKQGKPDWQSFYYPDVQELPAVKWECYNLQNMSAEKKKSALENLENVLKQL